MSVALERGRQRAERKSKLPELPVLLEHLERRLKEKPHPRAELVAWLDGGHAWCEWEGQLSTQLFETRSGPSTALDAFREANPCVEVEMRDGVETFVYRLAYTFRSKSGLEAAIRASRSGMVLNQLVAHMESEYKTIRQDVDALLRERLVFAVDDDRRAGKKGKVLFACVDRAEAAPLFADKATRDAYAEVAVPDHFKVLEILQHESEFKLPDDVYQRKRDRGGGGAPKQQAPARKRARMRNATNPASLLGAVKHEV